MNLSNNVPTSFAKSLAESSDILVNPEPGRNHLDYTERLMRLKAFQQMAIVVPFEECLIAFHGQELSEMQKDVLSIIYKSTKPWMLGHVVGVLLDKLDGNMANKDFAESVKVIVEQLTATESGGTEKLKGMMITLTNKE